ncbi:MAG: alkaline phosphatase family protein [Planctomycetota bacterium]
MMMRTIKRLLLIVLLLLGAHIAGPQGSAPARSTGDIHDAPPASPSRNPRDRRVIVLGFDGFDPRICRELIAQGKLPHLAKLAQTGSFHDLQTSMPPLSPVAWSEFTTGADASVHGIFDFLHRDAATMKPVMSMACAHSACCTLPLWPLGPWQLPIGGSVELLRRGKAFWQVLDEAGVATTVIACPANYPPPPSGGRSLAGMGTPDMLGTRGRFTFFSEQGDDDSDASPAGFQAPDPLYPLPGRPATAGARDPQETAEGRVVRFRFGRGGAFLDELRGPPMPLDASGAVASVPIRLRRDPANRAALIDLDGTTVLLGEGEWTPMWIPLRLPLGIPGTSTTGMVRMLLASLSPLRLYVSPINIDPVSPAQTLSTPDGYARELAERLGRYYTETIPEDVGALEAGALDRDEFLELAHHVLAERRAQLDFELSRHRRGLLFVYFGGSDLVQHVFFKEMRQEDVTGAPWRDAVAAIYAQLDDAAGHAMESIAGDPDAVLIVLSDHGFSRYRRAFDVNAWLAREGFRDDSAANATLDQLDWSRTRAFGLGLNGLYLNLASRDAHGIVAPADAPALLATLREKLLAERDPADGAAIFHEVYITRDLYPGIAANAEIDRRAPDLLLGYAPGYRTAGASSEGGLGQRVIEDNHSHWTGDHCTDWRDVPGVIFSNRPLAAATVPAPGLRDLAPTLLALYGVRPTAAMHGRSLLR